jgi:IPT/TIG domain-containing protein
MYITASRGSIHVNYHLSHNFALLMLLWVLSCTPLCAQSVSIIGPASYTLEPGQNLHVALETDNAGGGVGGCILMLNAQGQAVPIVSIAAPYPYQVTITIPPTTSPGTYILQDSCKNTSGQTVSSNTVTVNIIPETPTITEFGLNPLMIGQNQTLTITGSGFGQSQGAGYVHLLGAGVPDITIANVNSWSDTQIVCVVPSSASVGTYSLVVHTDSTVTKNSQQSDSAPVAGLSIILPPMPPQQPWASILIIGPASTPIINTAPPGPALAHIGYKPSWTPLSGAVLCDAGIPSDNLYEFQEMYCNFPQVTSDITANTIYVTDRTWQIPVQLVFQDDTSNIGYWMGSYSKSSDDLNDPGTLGNKAHFNIAVEEFADCLLNASGNSVLVGSAPGTCQNETTSPSSSICSTYTTGPDGNLGCWVFIDGYHLGTGQMVADDLYGPSASGVPTSKQASANGFVTETLLVSAHLLHFTGPNYVSVSASGYLGDTRPWQVANWVNGAGLVEQPNANGYNFSTGVSWNSGPIYDPDGSSIRAHPSVAGTQSFDFNLFSANAAAPDAPPQGCLASMLVVGCPATGQPVAPAPPTPQPISSFEVRVLPVATEQLRVVPYTILYQPPGNNSWVQFSTAVTEGTSYSIGDGGLSNQGTTNSNQQCQSYTNGVQLNLSASYTVGGSTPFIQYALAGSSCVGAQETSTTSQSASQIEQEITTNLSTSLFNVPLVTAQNGKPQPIPSLTPGNTGIYADEPFWYDSLVLNLGQPYLIFMDNGTPVTQLLPEAGWPDLVSPTLAQIASCAYGVSVQLPAPYGGSKGQTISAGDVCNIGNYPDDTPVILSAAEAQSLLRLDPFYPVGQSTDPTQLTSTNKSPRATALTYTCGDIESCPPPPSNSISNVQVNSQQSLAAFGSAVSNFQAFAQQNTFTLFGNTVSSEGQGGANSSAVNTGTTASGQVSYSTSTALTTANTMQWTVQLSDVRNPPLTNVPINVYQDNVFGTPMFRDQNAPPPLPYFPFDANLSSILQRMALSTIRLHQIQPDQVRKACTPWPSCILGGQIRSSFVQPAACVAGGNASPVVTMVTPNSGLATGGIAVVIEGHGFCGSNSVTVGGRAATSFYVISDSEVRAVLPGISATVEVQPSGYVVDVAVCTPSGCSPQYIPGNFKYLAK